MGTSHRDVERLTSDIMGSVQGCMAGLEIIASRDNAQKLASLRTQVRSHIETAQVARPRIPARLPSWMLVGFALSLLGGLMGFVGAAKSYEVAGTQQETVRRLDAILQSGALERMERVSQQLGDAELLNRVNELEAFQLRAAQAVRDLAELQETTSRLRKFQ
ncbi:MAG: hypothetical protein U0637_10255 [Phycisphaerales bacterium]